MEKWHKPIIEFLAVASARHNFGIGSFSMFRGNQDMVGWESVSSSIISMAELLCGVGRSP